MYDNNRAKDELENILSQTEYQVYYEDNRNLIEIWWDRAKSWVADLLSNMFSSFNPSSGTAGGILILIIIAFALVILVVLVRYNRHRSKHVFRDSKPLQSTNEINWSFRNHLTEAQKQEDLNQYSIAVRHLFLALLLYFHDKEWLEARIWKTNWEYYEELRKVNQIGAEQFYNLALVFDEVAYGERTMKQIEYIQYKNRVMNWLEEKDSSESLKG